MLQLLVLDVNDDEVIAIKKFFKWVNIECDIALEPHEVRYLNQGKLDPILMKDSLIVARGFYEVINYIRSI